MAVETYAGFVGLLALTFQVAEVGCGGVPNPVGAAIDHLTASLAGSLLSLPEGEDCGAVGVGHIVGRTDGVGDVGLVASVASDYPTAPSGLMSAVAKVEAFTDRLIIWLPRGLEFAPARPRFQIGIPNPPSHFALPFIGRGVQQCPIYG